MNFRVRGPSGQSTLTGVEDSTTIAQFLSLLEEKTHVPAASIDILAGFPPKPLQFPSDHATPISTLGIQSGEILTVQQRAPSAANHHETTATADVGTTNQHSTYSIPDMSEDEQLARAIAASMGHDISPLPSPKQQQQQPIQPIQPIQSPPLQTNNNGQPSYQPLPDGTAIVRRIVADDNSCLFSAVGYVLQGTRSAAASLRSIVADAVIADPIEWNEAILGKDPKEYSTWIQNPLRWGGAIELSILSKAFNTEIAAFDVQTKRAYIYGEGAGYERRALLIYDGLHYDAMAVCSRVGGGESEDTTQFVVESKNIDMIMDGAATLVARFHEAKQYTDTANFQLRCGVCKLGLRGEKEATMHAQQTGHTQFTEY